jgi:hypothetical protein
MSDQEDPVGKRTRSRVASAYDSSGTRDAATGVPGKETNTSGLAPAASLPYRGTIFPLPAGIRAELETVTNTSLAHVRVHADDEADQIASSHATRAVAIGADIYVADGHVDFESREGRELIAHEVGHVVQASSAAATREGAETTVDAAESDADRLAAEFADRGASARWRPQALLAKGAAMRAPKTSGAARSDSASAASASGGTHDLRATNQQLVGDLLQAIDHSARAGLQHLAGKSPDLEAANATAVQITARIEHLLSITAVPGQVGAKLSSLKQSAEIALGRAAQFARELENVHGKAEPLQTALGNVSAEIAPTANWHWKPVGLNRPAVGHGFVFKEGVRIGASTLAMVAHRARFVADAKRPEVVKVAAQACQEDLVHARRELSLAIDSHPELRPKLADDVLNVGEALAVLEAAAFRTGIGEDATVSSMRDAESALRSLVDLPSPRPFWDSSVSTLSAIVDILNKSHAVDRSKGVASGKWHPSQHPEVPARYRPLLDEWFLIAHGSVKQGDGSRVEIRGPMLATHIDRAVAETMALVNLVQKEGDPNTLAIVDDLFSKVSEFRQRVTTEIVDDAIDEEAKDRLERGDSPIAQLSEENQLKVASMRLMQVSRAMISSAQRVASGNKQEAKIALELFQKEFKDAPIPPHLRDTIGSANSIADVAIHISALASAIQAVLNIADPAQRHRLFETEFKKFGIAGGSAEILKTLGALAQGGVAAYGIAGYALMRAGGYQIEASALFAGASKTIGNIGTAVNVLNVVHGALMIWNGNTGEKVSGAVEATWGTLGLVGKFAPRFARFTGPLSAAIMISWTTINWIGEKAMGALYGLIQFGLTMAYENMKTHALEIHGEATRLATALEMGSSFTDQDQLAELEKRITTYTRLLAASIKSYVDRSQVRGRNQDPGTYKPFRTRFKPLVGADLDSELGVLLAAEQFLEIVVGCFENGGQVLEEAVQDSLEEHGKANKQRF